MIALNPMEMYEVILDHLRADKTVAWSAEELRTVPTIAERCPSVPLLQMALDDLIVRCHVSFGLADGVAHYYLNQEAP